MQQYLPTLKESLTALCQELRRAVSASQQAARRITGKQAIQRLIDDYFVGHQQSSSVFEIQLLLERIQKDTELLGVDGESLDASLKRLLEELKKVRDSGQQRFVAEVWHKWRLVIEAVRKIPLNTTVTITDGFPVVIDPAQPTGPAPAPQPAAGDGTPALPAPEGGPCDRDELSGETWPGRVARLGQRGWWIIQRSHRSYLLDAVVQGTASN